jgi:ppGpp synthetase/RelA/SpoT-type nucleotidyltranferase
MWKNEKPENIEEYKKWLCEKHGFTDYQKYQNYYESVVGKAKLEFESSEIWQLLKINWNKIDTNYYALTNYKLFSESIPEVDTKTYNSFLWKTFRKNIIDNENFPEPPKEGSFLLPQNWYGKMNDIIRTKIIVKYLDGVDMVLNYLKQECKNLNIPFNYDYEAKDEGYYAVHCYLTISLEVPDMTWDTVHYDFMIEIQITTQIKDLISKMTHKYYEQRRVCLKIKDEKWQWNYKDEAFTVNYLGHILHYLEGMILEIRDKGCEK